MRKSFCNFFSRAPFVVCIRLLEDNACLTLLTCLPQQLITEMFTSKGLMSHADVVIFDNAMSRFQRKSLTPTTTKLVDYFNTQLWPTLRDKVLVGRNGWTNNNCESINHVLKATTQWRRNQFPDFIDRVRKLIYAQYNDADRALCGLRTSSSDQNWSVTI